MGAVLPSLLGEAGGTLNRPARSLGPVSSCEQQGGRLISCRPPPLKLHFCGRWMKAWGGEGRAGIWVQEGEE